MDPNELKKYQDEQGKMKARIEKIGTLTANVTLPEETEARLRIVRYKQALDRLSANPLDAQLIDQMRAERQKAVDALAEVVDLLVAARDLQGLPTDDLDA